MLDVGRTRGGIFTMRWKTTRHGEELRLAREHGARPMLDRLQEYLLTIREQVLPKSEAGQSIAYTFE